MSKKNFISDAGSTSDSNADDSFDKRAANEAEFTATDATVMEIAKCACRAALQISDHLPRVRSAGRNAPYLLDSLALGVMQSELQHSLNYLGVRLSVKQCEGEKDKSPISPFDFILGSQDPAAREADGIFDPVEGTNDAIYESRTPQGSFVAMAMMPSGLAPALPAAAYSEYLFLPKGVDAEGLDPESNAKDVISRVSDSLEIRKSDITVFLLDRDRNKEKLREMPRDVRVELIPGCDLQRHIMAAASGSHISKRAIVTMGTGGLPETLLALPAVRGFGGAMRMKVVPQAPDSSKGIPIEEVEKGIRAGRYESGCLETTFTEKLMPEDSFLVLACITDSALMPGVRVLHTQPGRRRIRATAHVYSTRSNLEIELIKHDSIEDFGSCYL